MVYRLIEISILIAVIGCFVGLGGWLKGRDGKIATDAERRGTVDTKLDVIIVISQNVKELDEKINRHDIQITKLESSYKSIYKRVSKIGGVNDSEKD